MNEKGKMLHVQGNVDAENRNIEVQNKNNGFNQQWDIVYVDQYKGPAKKGELSKEYGFYVLRPFYIISEMPRHRYIDCSNGKNMVISYPNGGKS